MSVPERRITRFPGNTTPVLGKRPAEEDLRLQRRFSASNLPRVPPSYRDTRHQPPAQIRLKVNTHSQNFSASTRFEREIICPFNKEGTPWSDYYAVLKEHQAGKIIVAYENKIHHQIVVIRERPSRDGQKLRKLKQCSHTNVVELKGTFQTSTSIFFVYEWIDVSIAEVQSAPCGKFPSYQIAAICKEVNGKTIAKEFAALKAYRSSKVSITYTKSLVLRMEQ